MAVLLKRVFVRCCVHARQNSWNAPMQLRLLHCFFVQGRCLRYGSTSNTDNIFTSLRRTFNKMVLYLNKHSPSVVMPKPGAQVQVHYQTYQDDFSWLQDLNNGVGSHGLLL